MSMNSATETITISRRQHGARVRATQRVEGLYPFINLYLQCRQHMYSCLPRDKPSEEKREQMERGLASVVVYLR
jgi:hypothetical protein